MPVVDTPFQLMPLPPPVFNMGEFSNFNLLNGTTIARRALVIQAPEDGQIDGVEWRMWTAFSTNPVKVSLQDVDGTGVPDGSIDQYGVLSSLPTGQNTVTLTHDGTSGGTRRTVTKGQMIAIVWEWDSTQSGNPLMAIVSDSVNLMRSPLRYWCTHNNTSWNTKGADISSWPSVTLRYVGGTYKPAAGPYNFNYAQYNQRSFASNSTPDEYAIKFTPQVSYRVTGAWIHMMNTTGNFDVVLYDSTNTALATLSVDADHAGATASVVQPLYCWFSNRVQLTAGQTYRLSFKPTTTTANAIYDVSLDNSSIMEATVARKLSAARSVRTDAGSWTDDATLLPIMGVITDGVEVSYSASMVNLATLEPMPQKDYMGQAIGYQGNYLLFNGNPSRFATIFQAPVTGEVDLVGFGVHYIAGANDVHISLQDVDANGLPDGGEDVYKVSSKATGWQTYALTDTGSAGGNRKTLTKGSWYAAVVKWNATASGSYESHPINTAGNLDMVGGTYTAYYNGSAWVKNAASSIYPSFGVKYTDGRYYPIAACRPMTSIAAESFASNSTPDERGLRFIPPAPIRVSGFWMQGNLAAATDVVLYDAAGTVLATYSHDVDYQNATGVRFAEFLFSAAVDLTAGQVYRLAVKPTTTTSGSLQVVTISTAEAMDVWPMGAEWHYTSRTDGGAWTETNTKRPLIGLLLSGAQSGVAGGSSGGTGRGFATASFGQRGMAVS